MQGTEVHMTKIKEVTKESWLVDCDDGLGILSKNNSDYILKTKNIKKSFKNRKEVSEYFKRDIFAGAEKLSRNKQSFYINGFPINFENPFLVEDQKCKLPLYAKNNRRKVHYCAGYYCVKLSKWWTVKYCLKRSKMEKYPFTGPYKTEVEARTELSKLRKKDEKQRNTAKK